MKISKIPIERIAAWVLVIFGVFLALQYALAPLVITALPFVFAWVMAYFARPIALRLHRHTRLSVGVLSIILVFLFLAVCGVLLFFAARQAVLELVAFGERFASETWFADWTASVNAWWADVTARFPFLAALGGEKAGTLTDLVTEWLSTAGSQLGDTALRAAGALASALPNSIIFLLVTLAAAFYFALDLGGIHHALLAIMPEKMQRVTGKLKDGAWQTMIGYLRAYLLLLLVTLVLLLVGFLLLRVPYAVLLAALISLLDLLPIIGVGTLLIPWGIVSCLTGNLATGIGLFALYAVIALVRQFLEPKLIGQHLGLHPLLALLATYAGLRLFGFWGLMLLPGALMILRQLFISEDWQAT
ncbi:MAG: sporulation integral membrane protein YtvI [Clostridia bacterium]|nr:sporulation integral membrane protein YtvI [Clostridia bacterium]